MSTTRPTGRVRAGSFVLAATLGLGTAFVLPAHSAVVAAAPSVTTTTVELASRTVAYGQTSTANVTVDTTANGGPKPTGKVELRVGGTVLVADLTNSGKVDVVLPLLDASTTPYAVTATFVPTDSTAFTASSSSATSVTVTKDTTTSTVTARHRVVKRRIITKNFVTSANGQVPTGEVTFVLRRNGRRIAAAVASLNGNSDITRNLARVKFVGVRKTGTYKVVAKYRGSTNFLASRGSYTIVR